MALGHAQFGVSTFFASSHANDKCGPNGLPLTPNSIKVIGSFQHLRTITHPNLCKYLDCVKGKHERLIIVQEHYTDSLALHTDTGKYESETELLSLAFEILQGLTYLNGHNVTHRNLNPCNILFDTEGKVKLSKYGLYHMTNHGACVGFPIGVTKYAAPEVLCFGPVHVDEDTELSALPCSSCKVDVWSLGCILFELISGKKLWFSQNISTVVRNVLAFLTTDASEPFDVLVNELECTDKIQGLSEQTQQLLRKCLSADPSKRPCPEELLQSSVFYSLSQKQPPYKNGIQLFTSQLRCRDLELPTLESETDQDDTDHLSKRSMEEVYYLWRLAGGDLEGTLRKAGLIKIKPPVTILPSLTLDDGEVLGQGRDQAELLDNTVILLSQEQLRKRLDDVDEKAYYPLLEDTKSEECIPTSNSSNDLTETASLPLVIKEKDVEYQFHRVILYQRLIQGYPYKKARILQEARVDIPPLFRNLVWAALLNVQGDIQAVYDSIDKETPTGTDRQIAVDIPRCHQYHELLSSPTAHAKFKRVLKAWVVSHSEYVYWQGLDSLCAPFLALNFNNEALAYACITAFIPKYLHKFFLKDNSSIIQEYLAVFSHMIAFHNPELSNHMEGIGFIPDLYAIPWFLTMFSHVFPLHKIVHLWDTLLLGNSSFPLCIGVAILKQFHDRLLSFGFNECILLFSDMPEIDIQQCVKDSIVIFCNTPKSAAYRQHARVPEKKPEDRPNVSYYSRDYNDQPQNDLSMEPIPLEELRSEKCPRISAEDLLDLGEFTGNQNTRSPAKRKGTSKPLLLVIDVRPTDEYKRGTVPGSINIPFQSAFSPEGDLLPCPAVTTLKQSKSTVKVVVGSRGRNASNFSSELVRLGYTRVCTLHKGIDVLRPTGILTVPPADI